MALFVSRGVCWCLFREVDENVEDGVTVMTITYTAVMINAANLVRNEGPIPFANK